MFFEHISARGTLFFILYGITGVVPLIACIYLLLRKGNAFAADIIPPMRLRRWAASFFAVSALSHVWWYLFYIIFYDFHTMGDVSRSVGYVIVVVLDCVMQLTTISGTLLSMLQDRRRPVWPAFVAMIPFAVLGGVFMVYPIDSITHIAIAYLMSIYVFFTIYMVFAVRQYGRWLRDNCADLEHMEVWVSQVMVSACMLSLILYALIDSDIRFFYLLHLVELTLFCLLLWRVETLPLLHLPAQTVQPADMPSNMYLYNIRQLLDERCVATQLYLRHDLTLVQLAKALGTNRTYLGQYFSSQGTTYNAYINDLRINYFISRYKDAVSNAQPVTAQHLASDSGYRSYSTFSLAFKQRMGQSVTVWIREMAKQEKPARNSI